MMHSSWVLILTVAALIGSWILTAVLCFRHRRHTTMIARKYADLSRQFEEQIMGIDSILDHLIHLHKTAIDTPSADVKLPAAQALIEAACQISHCPVGYLLMFDQELGQLYLVAQRGATQEMVPGFRLRLGEGIAGRTAESGKALIVENSATDARSIKIPDMEYRSQSFLSLPILHKHHVLGVLNLHSSAPDRKFDERMLKWLYILMEQAAISFENLDLNHNLQTFYLEMIETLSQALESKENIEKFYIGREQMRFYARHIAENLHLPEAIAKQIEFAVMAYRIGKIGIDESILKKPGKLTDSEYEQMKKHPEIAHKLMSKIKFLSPVTPIILYHQERWDGKGYPAGLKGEEIPLGSRVVAVLNAYSAMRTDRPYRKAMSAESAIEELRHGAGSQFDPRIVETFVRVLQKEKNLNDTSASSDSREQTSIL